MFLRHQSGQFRKALSVQVSHRFGPDSAVFDDDHLVSCAGLVPVMTLAAQTGDRVAGQQDSYQGAQDRLGVGQPGAEVGDGDRRHVRRRGQHR